VKRVAAILLIPTLAHADPQDARAKRMASEANLEPTRRREGLALGVAIGPSMQIGFRIPDTTGTGGSVDLRVGTSASERLSWMVDVFYAGTSSANATAPIETSGLLAIGAQYFVLETLWLRGGVGLATLSLDKMTDDWGFGAFGGGGIDLLRHGRFSLSGDFSVVSGAYSDGFVTAAVAQLGATWW